MGTCIHSVATTHPAHRLFGAGALHLTDKAARTCLARAHLRPSELDLLVNVGLYKDEALAEPALAAIVQDDLGANPGHPPREGFHGTFSFDLLAGGCGVITAAHVLDSFVGPGSAQAALIVAGDADPSPRTTHGFPFAPAAGAVLLVHEPGAAGFQRFAFRTFPEHALLFESAMRWEPGGLLRRGRNAIEVREDPEFAPACTADGIVVAGALLADAGLAAADVDVMIASQYPRGFAAGVARGLGIEPSRLPAVDRALERAHTAGPIAALEAAIESGAFAGARHVLFVTAGAGITIGAALYTPA